MRNARMLIALVLVLLTPACSQFEWLNPCYKPEDVVLDPALAGTWKEEDGASVLKFREAGDKSYKMIDIEENTSNSESEQTKYDAHLVRLGDYLFLDMVPEVSQAGPGAYKLPFATLADLSAANLPVTEIGDGLYASLIECRQGSEASQEASECEVRLTQAHMVYQVQLDGTSLRLIGLSKDWFKEAVHQGRIHAGFENIDDTVVFTGPTEELRAMLLDIGGEGLAFPKDHEPEFHRQE